MTGERTREDRRGTLKTTEPIPVVDSPTRASMATEESREDREEEEEEEVEEEET